MHKKLLKIGLICSMFIGLIGCTQLKDFVNENPAVVSIAVRQAVAQYVEIGKTIEEKQARAKGVSEVLEKVKTLVQLEQAITVDNLLEFTKTAIDWDKMSVSDKMAAQDILLLVDISLKKYENNVDPNTLVVINGIIRAAQSATQLY